MYHRDDEDIVHDAWMDAAGEAWAELKAGVDPDDEPECECRFSGDQADASECELHNLPRKPMGTWIETPCSCMDGDTRTCFLHGEVA